MAWARKSLIGGVILLGLAAPPAQAAEWWSRLQDPEDGQLDVSGFLRRGGFVPVPIIITEPAVDGGLGLAGQFLTPPTDPDVPPGRTIFGGAYTGNGSWGGGLLRQGALAEGRFLYRFGLGLADVNLPIFPFGGTREVDYENKTQFAFGNMRYRVPDTNFSFGPQAIYRTSDVSLATEGEVADRVGTIIERFSGRSQYAALGLIASYDSRNNSLTPTQGTNIVAKYNAYSGAIGSDADFTEGQLNLHHFQQIGDADSLGAKLSLDAVSAGAPFFMSPSVDLRGVQFGRYQGDRALSFEAELRHQFTPRWAGVAFGGYGQTFVDNSQLYAAKSGIWTYGAGVRYRIAREFGIDVGLDIARGPADTVFYIQFGHAWGRTMD